MAGEDALDVEILCEEIALAMGTEGWFLMKGMCGNKGQEAILDNAEDDWWACVEDASQGDPSDFETDHDDAVEVIVGAGNDILDAIAIICEDIRTSQGEAAAAEEE